MENYGNENDYKTTKQRRWTQSAVECYLIGCTCSKCYLYPILKDKCKMKNAVIELVRQFGKPQVRNERR
ncbi:hypothetical protein IJD34_03805 [bacterium]|nr:hypothetical protein [bacterium]